MNQWRFLGILSLILCISYVTYSGLVKVVEPVYLANGLYVHGKHSDGHYYYVAGKTWLAGQSPYNFNTFLSFWKKDLSDPDYKDTRDFYEASLKEGYTAFIYPPTLGILSIPLALFSWKTAQIILDILNILALLSIIFFLVSLTKKFLPTSVDSGKIWLGVGLSGFMSAVPVTIYISQSSLLVTMAFLGTIYFYLQSRILVAALFVVVASIKPQLSMLPLIYLFILAGNWRFIIWSTFFVGITTISILAIGGDYHLPLLAKNLLSTHISLKLNNGGLPGIYWFMWQINNQQSFALIFSTLGILFVTGLTLFFKQTYQDCLAKSSAELTKIKTFLLLMFYLSLVALLMPQHSFDHVVLMPLFALLFVMRWQFVILLLPGLFLIARPGNIAYYLKLFFEEIEKTWLTANMIASFGTLWITLFFAIVLFRFANEVVEVQYLEIKH